MPKDVFKCGDIHNFSRSIHLHAFSNELPTFSKILLWSSELKVIDIYSKEEFEVGVPVTAPPFLNGLKTSRNLTIWSVLV